MEENADHLCVGEINDKQLTGPELVQVTSEKVSTIQQRLKTIFDRWKSQANPKKNDISFSTEDLVFLEVSHMKGVMMFDKK